MTEQTEYTGENCRRKQDRRKADRRKGSLSNCIQSSLLAYFQDLDGHKAGNLYELIMVEAEKPLLSVVMEQTNGNITQAAEILGLNRGTLRKKLQKHNIGK